MAYKGTFAQKGSPMRVAEYCEADGGWVSEHLLKDILNMAPSSFNRTRRKLLDRGILEERVRPAMGNFPINQWENFIIRPAGREYRFLGWTE